MFTTDGTYSENDGTQVREKKKKMRAFHTSQHATSPAPDMARQAPVWKGQGESNQSSQHAVVVVSRTRSRRLVLPAGAPAPPASEARRQTPCMPAWHSWGSRRAKWGKGRTAVGRRGRGGVGYGGRGRFTWWVEEVGRGQTDKREMEESADYDKSQRCWRREENRWTTWRLLLSSRSELNAREEQTVTPGQFKATTDVHKVQGRERLRFDLLHLSEPIQACRVWENCSCDSCPAVELNGGGLRMAFCWFS